MPLPPVHFGFSIPPIGPSMGDLGVKLVDSFSTVPVTNIPGPPVSFYADSFEYLRGKKVNEGSASGITDDENNEKESKPDPQDTLQLTQQPQAPTTAQADNITLSPQPGKADDSLNLPGITDSATISNAPKAIESDIKTAQQYNQLLDSNQPILDVSPV